MYSTVVKAILTWSLFIPTVFNEETKCKIGSEKFEEVVECKSYIDRTWLIENFLSEKRHLLITAPQKFGKSVNMNMLKNFLRIRVAENGAPLPKTSTKHYKLFSGQLHPGKLYISNKKSLVEENFGSHPVLYLDFRDIETGAFDVFLESFKAHVLHPAFEEHLYLKKSKKLSAEDIKTIEHFTKHEEPADKLRCEKSAQELLSFLAKHFGKDCFLLIDEFDAPIKKIILDHKIDISQVTEIIDFFKQFLSITLKGSSVRAVLINAVSRVDGVFAPNLTDHLHHIPFTANEKIAQCYGFSLEDVKTVGWNYGTDDDEIERIKQWYGGYLREATNAVIYRTFSVVNYFYRRNAGYQSYWNFETIWSGGTKSKPSRTGLVPDRKELIPSFLAVFLPENAGKSVLEYFTKHSFVAQRYNVETVLTLRRLSRLGIPNKSSPRMTFLPFQDLFSLHQLMADYGYYAMTKETTRDGQKTLLKVPNNEAAIEINELLFTAVHAKFPNTVADRNFLSSAVYGLENNRESFEKLLKAITHLLDQNRNQPQDEVELGLILGSAVNAGNKGGVPEKFRFNFPIEEGSNSERADMIFIMRDKTPVLAEPVLNTESDCSDKAKTFEKVIACKAFVDKTLLIKAFLKSRKPLMVTAPSGFGKTINMDMLKTFLEIKTTENGTIIPKYYTRNYDVFFGRVYLRKLAALQLQTLVDDHFGEHPVLHMNFRDVEVEDFDTFLRSFKTRSLYAAFKEHAYLKESPHLTDSDKETLEHYMDHSAFIDHGHLIDSGHFLSILLRKHFKKDVIILIDDFDGPMRKMVTDPYLTYSAARQIMHFWTTFLTSISKRQNSPIKASMMTGRLPLGEQFTLDKSTQDLRHVPFDADSGIAKFFGLSKGDVETVAARYGMNGSAELNKIKHWYNGYTRADAYKDIYSVHSVVSYFLNQKFQSYWADSGVMSPFVGMFLLENSGRTILESFSKVSAGVQKKYTTKDLLALRRLTQIGARPLNKTLTPIVQEDERLFLLYMKDSGYFSALRGSDTPDGRRIVLEVPNNQAAIELNKLLFISIHLKFSFSLESRIIFSSSIFKIDGSLKSFESFLEAFVLLMDQNKEQPRDEIEQALILGSALTPAEDDIVIEKMRFALFVDSGERIDMLFIIRDRRPKNGTEQSYTAFVLDMKFKWKLSYRALEQIVNKKYYKALSGLYLGKDFPRLTAKVYIGLHCEEKSCSMSYLYNTTNLEESQSLGTARFQ